jgi:hypothetical protein
MELTDNDYYLIMESLKYTILKFESYTFLPNFEENWKYKNKRIEEISFLIQKINKIKKGLK